MEFYRDWKFWMFVIASLNTFLTIFSLVIIKFNDFKHVGKDMTEIKEKLDTIEEKQREQGEAIASMKGICAERGKVLDNITKQGK